MVWDTHLGFGSKTAGWDLGPVLRLPGLGGVRISLPGFCILSIKTRVSLICLDLRPSRPVTGHTNSPENDP